MKPSKYLIYFAKKFWFWYWEKLMDGFAPSDKNGHYTRKSGFNNNNNNNKLDINFEKEEKLYLIVGSTCPWCHRTILLHSMNNLSTKIDIIFLQPNYAFGEWRFEDEFLKIKTLNGLYKKINKKNIQRPTVPILVKLSNKKLQGLSNESTEIVNFLKLISDANTDKKNIKACDENFLTFINDNINNGVYKCGFARNQKAYNSAIDNLFSSLNYLDHKIHKTGGPWIFGKDLTIADIYLFPTLIRWEIIYSKLFKCSKKEISEFKHLMKWRLNFYNLKGVSDTCSPDKWIEDYYKAIFPLNPNNIVPTYPSLEEIIKNNVC